MTAVPAPLRAFTSRLSRGGLDLCSVFSTARYDAAIADSGLPRITTFGRDDALGLVVGNGRALHEALRALEADDAILASSDPIDDYARRVVEEAASELAIPHRVHLGHERPRAPISLVHAALASGLAHRTPFGMAIHPEVGLWFGLRAVLVFDLPSEPIVDAASRPCEGCAMPCVPASERARATLDADARRSIAENADLWIAVRDACPVGRAHRYDEAMLRYHTTKDRRCFDRALARNA